MSLSGGLLMAPRSSLPKFCMPVRCTGCNAMHSSPNLPLMLLEGVVQIALHACHCEERRSGACQTSCAVDRQICTTSLGLFWGSRGLPETISLGHSRILTFAQKQPRMLMLHVFVQKPMPLIMMFHRGRSPHAAVKAHMPHEAWCSHSALPSLA